MVLCVMSEMVRLRKVIEGSGHARGAEGKVIEEGGKFSGRHSVQEVDASAQDLLMVGLFRSAGELGSLCPPLIHSEDSWQYCVAWAQPVKQGWM